MIVGRESVLDMLENASNHDELEYNYYSDGNEVGSASNSKDRDKKDRAGGVEPD